MESELGQVLREKLRLYGLYHREPAHAPAFLLFRYSQANPEIGKPKLIFNRGREMVHHFRPTVPDLEPRLRQRAQVLNSNYSAIINYGLSLTNTSTLLSVIGYGLH